MSGSEMPNFDTSDTLTNGIPLFWYASLPGSTDFFICAMSFMVSHSYFDNWANKASYFGW